MADLHYLEERLEAVITIPPKGLSEAPKIRGTIFEPATYPSFEV
jgi:hypothetical protein